MRGLKFDSKKLSVYAIPDSRFIRILLYIKSLGFSLVFLRQMKKCGEPMIYPYTFNMSYPFV